MQGPSQLLGSAELGRKAMRDDVFDVASAVKSMSQSELEAFRVGALQALREKAGTQGGQANLLKMWMEPATQQRLKVIFGNDYRTFAANVAKEARMKGLETVGRGSQTAARQSGLGDLGCCADCRRRPRPWPVPPMAVLSSHAQWCGEPSTDCP